MSDRSHVGHVSTEVAVRLSDAARANDIPRVERLAALHRALEEEFPAEVAAENALWLPAAPQPKESSE